MDNKLKELEFVPLDFDDSPKNNQTWDKIREKCPGLTDVWVQKLRFGQSDTKKLETPWLGWMGLEGTLKGILIEPNYLCKDYRNLFSNFYSKKFTTPSARCTRLHFFSKGNLDIAKICFDSKSHQDDYIGFSVIQPIENHCIGRTVIDPFKCTSQKNEDEKKEEKIYVLRAKFDVNISGKKYEVKGYPFISQSDEVMVCAHAATWGVLRYLSTKHKVYQERLPYDIVQMPDDSWGRKILNRSMLYRDYSRILSQFGCFPLMILEPSSEDISPYIESGFPVLASFGGHVITLIGHTLNSKNYHKIITNPSIKDLFEGIFFDSSHLSEHYLISDDNVFPYQYLGDSETTSYSSQYIKSKIIAAIIPLPEKAFMEANVARLLGQQYLLDAIADTRYNTDSNKYYNITSSKEIESKDILNNIKKLLQKHGIITSFPLIIRTLLVSSKSFKERKNEYFLENGISESGYLYSLNIPLPHFVWVIELTTLELYKEHRIIGEVVIDATAYNNEQAILYARVLDSFISKVSKKLCNSKIFRQFRHNLHYDP